MKTINVISVILFLQTIGITYGNAEGHPAGVELLDRADRKKIESFVERLFDRHEAKKIRGPGIFDKLNNPDFSGLLTISLRQEFEAAKESLVRIRKALDGGKLPFPEGAVFTGEYESGISWKIKSFDKKVDVLIANLDLTLEGEASASVEIALVVHLEGANLMLDDVIYNGGVESLRTVLRETLLHK